MARSRTFGTRFALVAVVVVFTLSVFARGGNADTGRSGAGYWIADANGEVVVNGDAATFGSLAGVRLQAPIVGIAAVPGGQGYWLVGADGGVFTFGAARFYGSMGGLHLNSPIVGMAATRSGRGYWMVASDGGVFSFGDADFYGSTGNLSLRAPIVGMAATRSGRGYWMVASDGGVFTFGDAPFYGSTGDRSLKWPVVGIATTPTGRGYWLAAAGGGVFGFGDAPNLGRALPPAQSHDTIAAIASSPFTYGFELLSGAAYGFNFGNAAERCVNSGVIIRYVPPSTTIPAPPVGIAMAFDRNVVAHELAAAGPCRFSGRSGVFRATSPWHLDVTGMRKDGCAPSVSHLGPYHPGDYAPRDGFIVGPGHIQMRSTQMGTHTRFLIGATRSCLVVARAGSGGKASLPFATGVGGDTLPFTAAASVTITVTGRNCITDVHADSDGRLIDSKWGSNYTMHEPAGTYWLSMTEHCKTRVS